MVKNKKGISLIVLIITIIVVIILAGAVLLNLSDTNVIDNASEAVLLSDVGNFKVQLDLYQMEKYMDENGSYDPSKLNANATSATYDGNNLNGITMYDMIPAMENKSNYVDFEIVGGELKYTGSDADIQNMLAGNSEEDGDSTPAIVNTVVAIDTIAIENSTINGEEYEYNNLVIPVGFKAINTTDASWDSMQYDKGLVIEDINGNQFVWVPVDGTTVKYEKDLTYPGIQDDIVDDTLPNGVISEDAQITKYGGFYIARYEAGKEGTDTLVSKKNTTVWTNIDYTNSKTKAELMYVIDEIKSGLVTGKMWDAAMDFAISDGKNILNSSSWGNYKDSISPANVSGFGIKQVCGYSDYWQVCNIYDLAGNVREWSNELMSGSDLFANRGGGYNTDASIASASYRNTNFIDSTYDQLGFRVALYIM